MFTLVMITDEFCSETRLAGDQKQNRAFPGSVLFLVTSEFQGLPSGLIEFSIKT